LNPTALFSSVFTPQQMRELVEYVASCVNQFDDEKSVNGVGFERDYARTHSSDRPSQ